jgi:hypothetical protein
MKNLILTIIITLSLGILTSCSKTNNIQANTAAFYSNPFTAKSFLATAD